MLVTQVWKLNLNAPTLTKVQIATQSINQIQRTSLNCASVSASSSHITQLCLKQSSSWKVLARVGRILLLWQH